MLTGIQTSGILIYMSITPREAYHKGYRSGLAQVDSWDAANRFEKKYCQHLPGGRLCDLEVAWWNGFDDSRCAPQKHALTCPLGITHRGGHAEC